MSLAVGIDYSTYEATLCALPLDGGLRPVWRTARFRKASQSGDDAMLAALAGVRAEMTDAFLALRVPLHSSDLTPVWIERGYGMSRRADFSLGAYLGAIYAACASYGLLVNVIEAREWKRIVTEAAGIGLVKDGTRGNANAKKAVANEACRGLLELTEAGTQAILSPDELDAFGIAYTARKLNREALAGEFA